MSSKDTYRLINPYIEGSVKTSVWAKNAFGAGKKLYNSISNYFTNYVKNFYMTVQNVETKELTHFKITERLGKDGMVDFNLSKLEGNFSPELEKKLVANIEKMKKQVGGRYRENDSPTESTSTSTTTTDESDYFRIPIQPISRFVYFYLPYYKLNIVGLSPLDYQRIFVPTFALPINPTLEIRFDLYVT
ncbi:MAG: hypothetical protein QW303_05645 [Nitrososphaerota archaeon]